MIHKLIIMGVLGLFALASQIDATPNTPKFREKVGISYSKLQTPDYHAKIGNRGNVLGGRIGASGNMYELDHAALRQGIMDFLNDEKFKPTQPNR